MRWDKLSLSATSLYDIFCFNNILSFFFESVPIETFFLRQLRRKIKPIFHAIQWLINAINKSESSFAKRNATTSGNVGEEAILERLVYFMESRQEGKSFIRLMLNAVRSKQ